VNGFRSRRVGYCGRTDDDAMATCINCGDDADDVTEVGGQPVRM